MVELSFRPEEAGGWFPVCIKNLHPAQAQGKLIL